MVTANSTPDGFMPPRNSPASDTAETTAVIYKLKNLEIRDGSVSAERGDVSDPMVITRQFKRLDISGDSLGQMDNNSAQTTTARRSYTHLCTEPVHITFDETVQSLPLLLYFLSESIHGSEGDVSEWKFDVTVFDDFERTFDATAFDDFKWEFNVADFNDWSQSPEMGFAVEATDFDDCGWKFDVAASDDFEWKFDVNAFHDFEWKFDKFDVADFNDESQSLAMGSEVEVTDFKDCGWKFDVAASDDFEWKFDIADLNDFEWKFDFDDWGQSLAMETAVHKKGKRRTRTASKRLSKGPIRNKIGGAWKTFIRAVKSAGSGAATTDITEQDLQRISKEDLNGRQIKTIVKTARLLVTGDRVALGLDHMETVLPVKKGGRAYLGE